LLPAKTARHASIPDTILDRFWRSPAYSLSPISQNGLKSLVYPYSPKNLKENWYMDVPQTSDFAHIGKSVIIKGELSGSEDLYVDGVVEGTIELQGNNLVIGPNGQVRANVNAKGVVVQGKLEGDIRASERAELRKSAVAVGDIFTQRIAVEDGAFFKGKVDIQREAPKLVAAAGGKSEHPAEAQKATAPAAGLATARMASGGASVGAPSSSAATKH
jgi:cytoskeletal protein CcmA (bactofilin family)